MSNRQRIAEQERKRRNRNVLVAVIAGVVVLAIVIAIVANNSSSKSGSSAGATETRPVTVTGAPLPAYDATTIDTAVGQKIPAVSGQSFDGTPVAVNPNSGKAQVILFVAHWCPHCRREVPQLSATLRATPLPANVTMTAISTGVNASAPNYPPSSWLAGEQWPTPVIADDAQGSAASAYGLTGYPYFVFVDASGKVVSRYSGEMPMEQFTATVNQLAGGTS